MIDQLIFCSSPKRNKTENINFDILFHDHRKELYVYLLVRQMPFTAKVQKSYAVNKLLNQQGLYNKSASRPQFCTQVSRREAMYNNWGREAQSYEFLEILHVRLDLIHNKNLAKFAI